MLIQALCDYYDILSEQGKMLPEGYSKVPVYYLVYLTPEGTIAEILDWREVVETVDKKGKVKQTFKPREIVLPKRTEVPGIDSNYIEHRPLYLFGLNYEKDLFTPDDRTDKARKSHDKCKETNLEFIEGMDTPVVNAYRNFLESWIPENEIENPKIQEFGKNYKNAGIAFCLHGTVEYLHEDKEIRKKWEGTYSSLKTNTDILLSQCAVTGRKEPIARIHSKIKGISGGLATGTVLVSFKNPSEESYGNSQSYNSNISETAMRKYTEALNYISGSKKQKMLLDDITVLYWAMSKNETCNDIMAALLFHNTDVIGAEEIEDMMRSLLADAREGNLLPERISMEHIDPDIDFYMLGLKPNSSRLSVKFLYRKKFGEILINIARHQSDLQISEEIHPISFWQIKKELISPKSKNDSVDPSLMTKIFEAVIYGTNYPQFLLATIIRRVKTDTENEMNRTRAGIIKACINRRSRISNKKEELNVALDKENRNSAYLCGRLFAVLEKLQQDASGNSLNRTIKDAYFASAASKPATIFPKLLKLAQNHLKKSKNPVFYNRLIQEVVDQIDGGFPEILPLVEQGKFMIGYYQQYQSFFVKNDNQTKQIKEED